MCKLILCAELSAEKCKQMKHEHFEDAQKQEAMNVRLVHCVVPVHYTLCSTRERTTRHHLNAMFYEFTYMHRHTLSTQLTHTSGSEVWSAEEPNLSGTRLPNRKENETKSQIVLFFFSFCACVWAVSVYESKYAAASTMAKHVQIFLSHSWRCCYEPEAQ